MGYQINSLWSKLRKNDIEKLNSIIDDEYCNELEIGRKLHIMKIFDELLEEALNTFNFDVVLQFMQNKNWEWYLRDDTYGVPSKEDIIHEIRSDFYKHGLFKIIELNEKSYGMSGGGIVFEMGMDGNYPDKNNCYLNIYFDIAHLVD